VIRRLTGIGAFLALIVLLGTTPAQAAYPGGNGRLAFVRGGNIFTVKTNGTGLLRLNSDGDNAHPRWSPDGRRIAYLTGGELWVMNADGTGKRAIYQPPPSLDLAANQPTWSPDGKYLAMAITELSVDATLARFSVADRTFTFFTEGPANNMVLPEALNEDISWSPSGLKILYAGSCEFRSCLMRLTLDAPGATHGTTQLLKSSNDLTFGSPDWQLNSSDYTYTEDCPSCLSRETVVFTDPDATAPITNAQDAVYSPTHGQIAFIRDTGTAQYVTLANLDGTNKRRIGAGSQVDWQPLRPSLPTPR
jgi:Tol biopolymer transport system component